MKFPELFLF